MRAETPLGSREDFRSCNIGNQRNTFINDVEKELQRCISDNTSLLDVDVIYEWLHSSMRKAAEKHFTRSTQKRGRDHEYEAAAAHRAQCRRDLRTLRHLHPQAWQVRCARARAAEADHHVRSIKRAQRRNLESGGLIELQEAWERRDFAATWKLTRILTVKRIGPKKRRLAAPQAASFSKQERMEHLARPGSQGGCAATPVDMSQTGHVPATDYTHAAHWARVSEPRFRKCLARAPFRKAHPAWSFPSALWRLLVESNALRGKQRHGIGFEQRATRSDVFDEVFRALVWHMCVSRRTPRSWHVSQGAKTTPEMP